MSADIAGIRVNCFELPNRLYEVVVKATGIRLAQKCYAGEIEQVKSRLCREVIARMGVTDEYLDAVQPQAIRACITNARELGGQETELQSTTDQKGGD